jgi:DNA-binding MarR family transcriptional regulator
MNSLDTQTLLERLAGLLRSETRTLLLQEGLQPIQLEVVHYLSICNRYSDTPMAVTDYLRQTKGSVSQTLKVLEKKGLISKTPDRQDKRITHLSVTAKGKTLLQHTMPSPLLDSALATVPDALRRNIQMGLTALLRQLQEQNHFTSFGQCHSCHHHLTTENGNAHCKLTGESLSSIEVDLICREHSYATNAAGTGKINIKSIN